MGGQSEHLWSVCVHGIITDLSTIGRAEDVVVQIGNPQVWIWQVTFLFFFFFGFFGDLESIW